MKTTLFILLLAMSISLSPAQTAPARLEVLEIPGEKLADNPLRDPVKRRAAVFMPKGYVKGTELPVVYYLPGYGASSEDFIRDPSAFAHLIQQLANDGLPLIIAVVDCRNRWGGSQYLNSPAQGDYADYVCQEIIPTVEKWLQIAPAVSQRIIAGHSSGGYGALMLGMNHHELFGNVVALAPDGEFEVTCGDWFKERALTRLTAADIETIMQGPASEARERGGLVELLAGLSAAFAPEGRSAPGRFRWILDEKGKRRPEVWAQWLALDPLEIIKERSIAFAPSQGIYLDGTTQDATLNNVAARHIYDALRNRHQPHCAHHEAPGDHMHALPQRLERGLSWVFGKPLKELPLPSDR
ncbi:MAG: yieL [Chthoniobacteraceae bacterium]|nr:yieL [Chthoniobacteraceae bacterium]